jgi:glycoprotein-N-acetylgalactosamine 3-beta-galactosyltransferase
MTGPKSADQIDDPKMSFVYLNITEDYFRITDKTLKTIEYVYDNLMNDFDWFVRANDDTYIIVENLRLFLADKCPNEKKNYGKVLQYVHHKHRYTSGNNSAGFHQGGSGVIISRESVRLFASALKKGTCDLFENPDILY